MGKFLSKLQVSLECEDCRRGRSEWVVDAPLIYHSSVTIKRYTVPIGFVTDFASVPRIPFAFTIFGDTVHAPACLHDWLYSTKLESRDVADVILYEAMMATKVPKWKAKAIYYAVRWFGERFYKR